MEHIWPSPEGPKRSWSQYSCLWRSGLHHWKTWQVCVYTGLLGRARNEWKILKLSTLPKQAWKLVNHSRMVRAGSSQQTSETGCQHTAWTESSRFIVDLGVWALDVPGDLALCLMCSPKGWAKRHLSLWYVLKLKNGGAFVSTHPVIESQDSEVGRSLWVRGLPWKCYRACSRKAKAI